MEALVTAGIDIALRQVEADNRRDMAGSAAFMAADFRLELNGVPQGSGADATSAQQVFVDLLTAAPDTQVRVGWLDGTGSRLVHQFSFGGTFTRDSGPFTATGKGFEVHACTIMEHDGKALTAFWRNLDEAEMGRQLTGAGHAIGTINADRRGGNFPWGRERDRMEAAGLRLMTEILEESRGDLASMLRHYHDPLVEIVAGRKVALSHATLLAGGGEYFTASPTREVYDTLCIGDRFIIRFRLHWNDPAGEPQSIHGCNVVEHDGARVVRTWPYYEDHERLVPGIYSRLEG